MFFKIYYTDGKRNVNSIIFNVNAIDVNEETNM